MDKEAEGGDVNLMLANRDYGPADAQWGAHTSSEGHQLQAGLEHAGWKLCGAGYDDLTDVAKIIKRYNPDRVFLQDIRDLDPKSGICFNPRVRLRHLDRLALEGIPTFTVLKDAWSWLPLQSATAETIMAAGIAHYYHERVIREVAPWTEPYPLLRIHHSVDADEVAAALACEGTRRRGCVTGAQSKVYPLRSMALANHGCLDIDYRPHPGYSNKGADTPMYLRFIAGYKVHIACASKWGAAFRKIIESVACGCTPITDLPTYDVLPEIDGALVRVPTDINAVGLRSVIDDTEARWDRDERMEWSRKAIAYYDWRRAGERLSTSIMEATHAVLH